MQPADEAIKVYVRIRPEGDVPIGSVAVAKSRLTSSKIVPSAIQLMDECTLKTVNSAKEKTYVFDKVFPDSTTQEKIYETVSHLVTDAVDGFNATVFAYGAISSGKTFTMIGNKNDLGIMPRMIRDLFTNIDKIQSEDPSIIYHIEATFVEIYNNKIRNLLKPVPPALITVTPQTIAQQAEENAIADKIEIHESHNLGVFLTGNHLRHAVKTADETIILINSGIKARATRSQGTKNISSRY